MLLVTVSDHIKGAPFVLHDMFTLPFAEIGAIVARSPSAARQLASRARRRVQAATVPDPDITRQRKIADAFLAASRDGDFDALLAMLDPHVMLRADVGAWPAGASRVVSGAAAVAKQALAFAWRAQFAQPHVMHHLASGPRCQAVVGLVRNTRRNLPIWISSPLASTADSTG